MSHTLGCVCRVLVYVQECIVMHTAENSRKHCFRDVLHNSWCQGRLAWLPDSYKRKVSVFEETKIGQSILGRGGNLCSHHTKGIAFTIVIIMHCYYF